MIKKLSLITVLFFSLISCSKNDKLTLVNSTGRINHVLIVIKNSDWQGEVGDALREIIANPLVGLPQEETQFSINQVTPRNFNNLFKPTRNIMFVGYDTINNFYTNNNVYASPQTTLSILGKSKEELINNINKHEKEIISTFKKNDLIVYQNKITKKHHNPKNIETFNKLGFTLKLPFSYNKVEDTGDFLWYRNTITKGQLNIIAFEVSYHSKNYSTKNNTVAYLDSITKKNISGQFDNTYMMIEPQFKPVTKKLTLSRKSAIESRGLWIVKNDFMGGPFISYTIDDKNNNRLIIIQGFSYSPETKKRDFVFELEAILKTFTIN